MERWLSKSRVLLGLCGVLLVAALNRQDPMVYGMFLFLAVVSVLGFLLPWLSLSFMTVRLGSAEDVEIVEGVGCDLRISIERAAPWPAFMVTIETEWEWASNRVLLSQTIPVIRAGRVPDLGRLVRFPCRGRYELIELRLSSGFPLGLTRAHRTMPRRRIQLHVLPQPQVVHWPLPWDVAEDHLGELTTRRMGQSYELGVLRPYRHGEFVGRVSWRASARVGELIIAHFQQSGSIRLRVIVEIPRKPSLGVPDSAGEQTLRLAVGVCDAALAHGAQLFLYMDRDAAPMRDAVSVRRALARAVPTQTSLLDVVAQAARDAVPGEQIAVVVPGSCAEDKLVASVSGLSLQGCKAVVCIALGRRAAPSEVEQARGLQRALEHAGHTTFMEAP